MTIRKFYTFRVNDTTPDDHIGRIGEITYRDGFLYYHDGSTPGGEIIGGGGSGGGPTSWSSITGKPSFATVATSGSYTDLINKPSIPTDINDLTDADGLLANTGDFVFSGGTASLPAGGTMVLDTFQVGGNKQSTLTLSTSGISSLDVGNNLRLRLGNGTGSEKDWILGSDGSIRFPDTTVQTTAYTGSYNDLTNKPTIPDLTGYATESWVNSQGFGSSGGANTGDVVFSYGTLSNPEDNTVRLQSQSINQIASYNFTPQGGDYSTTVWDGQNITFNDPTQAIYDAIWALTDVSVVEVQVGSTWYTVTYAGSSTPGMPAAATLFVNESAVGGPLNIDNVQITINQGTTSYVEIAGTDFRVDVQDDIRMYGNDAFRLVNRSTNAGIEIQTNDGNNVWNFKSDGKLQLPSGGDIIDDNGNSVLSGGSSSGWGPGNNIVQNVDTDLRLVVQDPGENNYRIDLAIEDDAGTVKTRMEMDYDRVQIEAGNGQNQWRFESSGQFRIPGNINTYDKDIEIIAMNAGTAGNITIKAVSNVNDIHYSQVQLTQSGVTITTDMDGTPGGKSFEFRDTGVLVLPVGGDIQDSTGTSVLGGGGTTLPADASGYLNNNGSGTLTWVAGNPTGSGMLPYNGVTVLSNTTTADWTEYTLSGTMDAFYDWNNNYTTITLSSQTAYGKEITVNTKNLWINDSKINSNDYLVIAFPSTPSVGDVFTVPIVNTLTTVNAGSFVVGETYTISSVGTTNWTSIGAVYGGAGQSFVATGAGSGTGTATTTAGAKKVIFKPASGHRAQSMAQGQLGPVVFGQGGTYDFMYVDLGGQNAGNPLTWVYAGVIDSIPSWYQFYF
jgi:hypothetical protein